MTPLFGPRFDRGGRFRLCFVSCPRLICLVSFFLVRCRTYNLAFCRCVNFLHVPFSFFFVHHLILSTIGSSYWLPPLAAPVGSHGVCILLCDSLFFACPGLSVIFFLRAALSRPCSVPFFRLPVCSSDLPLTTCLAFFGSLVLFCTSFLFFFFSLLFLFRTFPRRLLSLSSWLGCLLGRALCKHFPMYGLLVTTAHHFFSQLSSCLRHNLPFFVFCLFGYPLLLFPPVPLFLLNQARSCYLSTSISFLHPPFPPPAPPPPLRNLPTSGFLHTALAL